MTGLCRSDALAIEVAHLEGYPVSAEACHEPATHLVIVRRARAGIAIEVTAEVCAEHELAASWRDGYLRSVKLRRREARV